MQGHLSSYNEDMPVEQLVQKVCDLKQGYTQFGGSSLSAFVPEREELTPSRSGLRPFGVSFLFAGHDPHHAFQLYATDPSGNYSGWKATCIGANNATAQSLLRQDYRDDVGLEEAMGLALKVLSKTMDSTSLDSEKRQSLVPLPRRRSRTHSSSLSLAAVEFATLTLDPVSGLPVAHIFSPAEIDARTFPPLVPVGSGPGC